MHSSRLAHVSTTSCRLNRSWVMLVHNVGGCCQLHHHPGAHIKCSQLCLHSASIIPPMFTTPFGDMSPTHTCKYNATALPSHGCTSSACRALPPSLLSPRQRHSASTRHSAALELPCPACQGSSIALLSNRHCSDAASLPLKIQRADQDPAWFPGSMGTPSALGRPCIWSDAASQL